MPRKGLGKGLGALLAIEEDDLRPSEEPVGGTQTGADSGVTEIDIRKIEPNRNQPRQYFDEAALDELADSIRTYGIIQPLILKDCGDYYNIIAGERRFRAARRANLDAVPAIVKDYTELETLQVALIENIQRQDLTPIEEALCYKRLMDDFFFSQEDIAAKVSKGRAAISSALRLLELDVRVQELVAASRLTVSHAKALLGIKDGDRQFEAAEHVAEDDLSVRATENLVAEILAEPQEAPMEPPAKEPEFIQNPEVAAAYRHAEEELMTLLGAKVNILQGKKKGKIEIEYYSPDELDRLLGLFKIKMTEEISEGE